MSLGREFELFKRRDAADGDIRCREEGDQVAVISTDDDDGAAPPEGDDDATGVGRRCHCHACK